MKTGADVVIVGASFAGLAAARALQGYSVVLVDPQPLGAFPKSACALPLTTVRAFGVEDAVLEVHSELVVYVERQVLRVAGGSPHATIDYGRFCRSLAGQSSAALVQAHALGYAPGRVHTTAGEIACRFAVDTSGPAAVLAASLRPWYADRGATGAGLEVEAVRPQSIKRYMAAFQRETGR